MGSSRTNMKVITYICVYVYTYIYIIYSEKNTYTKEIKMLH